MAPSRQGANPCDVVTKMEKVVSETKKRAEVTERYMQRWDEIEHIKRDGREGTRKIVTEEVTKEVTKEVTEEVTDTFNRLISILIDARRVDDLARAAKEPEYQKKLIEELKAMVK